MKKSKEYQRGFKEGYHKCLHNHHIVHGKEAKELIEQVLNPKPPTAKQKKFLKECGDAFNKIFIDKPNITCSQCNFENTCYDKQYVGTSYCSFRPKKG